MRASPPDNWVTRRLAIVPYSRPLLLVNGAPSQQKLARATARVLTIVLLVVAALEVVVLVSALAEPSVTVGFDFRMYMDRTRDFLAGQGFYLPHQLAGPYTIAHGDALYPPTILYLLVPFLVLPAVLWWAIPLGLIAYAIRRSPWWAWPLLAALLVYPRTWTILLYGNPSMWVMAFLAMGWYGLAVLKPTMAPFVLVGIRDRRTWVTLAVLVVLTLPLPWQDYIAATLNATSPYGPEYLLGELPIAAVLVLATWASRRRPAGSRFGTR